MDVSIRMAISDESDRRTEASVLTPILRAQQRQHTKKCIRSRSRSRRDFFACCLSCVRRLGVIIVFVFNVPRARLACRFCRGTHLKPRSQSAFNTKIRQSPVEGQRKKSPNNPRLYRPNLEPCFLLAHHFRKRRSPMVNQG